MAEGSLEDTYAAALRHGLVDPADDATLVGVVRRPSPQFSALVDENRTELGPPAGLLDELRERRRDLGMAGLCEEEAHNSAWEQVEFEARYRMAIERGADARATSGHSPRDCLTAETCGSSVRRRPRESARTGAYCGRCWRSDSTRRPRSDSAAERFDRTPEPRLRYANS